MEVVVHALRDDYVHLFPQGSGQPAQFFAGDVAALRCGSIDIIVCGNRCQCFSPSVFSDLHIDPSAKRVLIPKSTQHFFGAFAPIAAEVIYMSAPGAVVPDPRRIDYRWLNTARLFPWNEDPIPGLIDAAARTSSVPAKCPPSLMKHCGWKMSSTVGKAIAA